MHSDVRINVEENLGLFRDALSIGLWSVHQQQIRLWSEKPLLGSTKHEFVERETAFRLRKTFCGA